MNGCWYYLSLRINRAPSHGLTLITATIAILALALLAATAAAADVATGDTALFARLDTDGNGQLTSQETGAEHRLLFDRLLRKADANHDKQLTCDEFLAGMTPTATPKPLEEKPPAEFPGADAIRWLLLSMDTSGDGIITQPEVPEKFRQAYQAMVNQIDRDKSGALERQELAQGGRFISQIAIRFADEQKVDVDAELKKLENSQGAAFTRFEGQRGPQPRPGMALGNPQQAQQTFNQLDANRDGTVTKGEVPENAIEAFEQLVQAADADRNGKLSQQEFVTGVRQLAGRRGGPRAGMREGGRRGRRGGPQGVLEGLGQGGSAAGGTGAMEGMDAMPGGGK